MPNPEVFPNPTVKKVIFQVKFPSLFYIESVVGKLQLRILDSFPKSAITNRATVVILDSDIASAGEAVASVKADADRTYRIWEFMSDDEKTKVELKSDALTVVSERHKTYRQGTEGKFRDAIELVVNSFLQEVTVRRFTRIGLRYIDECPVPEPLTSETFHSWYSTTLPLNRFDLESAEVLEFRAQVRRGTRWLQFAELFRAGDDRLQLDFDGYAKDVDAENWLAVTDELHDLIWNEYTRCIKEPVYQYMREPKES